MQPDPGRVGGDSEHLGDLGTPQTFQVAQREDLSIDLGQGLDRSMGLNICVTANICNFGVWEGQEDGLHQRMVFGLFFKLGTLRIRLFFDGGCAARGDD